jgi:WD40 repeat protein
MVIKIDAGIVKAVALDDELLVATEKPVAVQCIRWAPDSAGIQTSTELVHRLSWMNKKSNVVDIIHDRAMSLFVWITGDGRAYAVQRNLATGATQPSETPRKLFRGYGFHSPDGELPLAIKAAINARFSLLALGCDDGVVHVYTARDYAGNIPLSHKLIPPISRATTGPITVLIYSPDGYCLFVGYEYGWLIWSVYGKLGGSSFVSNTAISQENKEGWLMGVQSGSWINAGSELLFTGQRDYRIWVLELVKSAVTGCYCPANVSRMLLHTSSKLLIDQKHLSLDMVSPSADASHWHEAQIPRAYLANQSPLRCVVISPDGRYVAVAGRRGLAHYSGYSGRWKTFDNPEAENAFAVRGGMCWYQHILIAAVEVGDRREVSYFYYTGQKKM